MTLMPPSGTLLLTILVLCRLRYRVHTLICRGSGLPLFFLLSPAHAHDAPFAKRLLAWAVQLYQIRPRIVRLDAAYWGQHNIRGKTYAKDLIGRADAPLTTLSYLALCDLGS